MTKITFDYDKLQDVICNINGYELTEDGSIRFKETNKWEFLLKGEMDSIGILFMWYNMIFKDYDWFIRVLKNYFKYAEKSRNITQFYKEYIEPYGLVWTNHSRFQMVDYHEYYRAFKSIIYIMKDPVEAMQSIYFWLNKEYDEKFVLEFIKYHLPRYIASIKFDGKYANSIVDYDALKGNPLVLKEIIGYIDDSFNEEAFEKAFVSPIKLEYKEFSMEAKELISEIWKREGMI